MAAVAHDPAFARNVGIKPSVGKDFMAADDAAGITKNPTMPRSEIKARLRRERDSSRSPAHGMSHAEFEKFGA
jgi:hypothetical protein